LKATLILLCESNVRAGDKEPRPHARAHFGEVTQMPSSLFLGEQTTTCGTANLLAPLAFPRLPMP
jgi:hypothetical protein